MSRVRMKINKVRIGCTFIMAKAKSKEEVVNNMVNSHKINREEMSRFYMHQQLRRYKCEGKERSIWARIE